MSLVNKKFEDGLCNAVNNIIIKRKQLKKLSTQAIPGYDTCPVNEFNYEVKLFFPLLKLLGWDVFLAEDVLLEAPVKIKSKEKVRSHLKKIDIALRHNGKYKLVIECKKVDNDDKKGDFIRAWKSQIRMYINSSDADCGIILTPKVLRFYKALGNYQKNYQLSHDEFTLYFEGREKHNSVLNYPDLLAIIHKKFLCRHSNKIFGKGGYNKYQAKIWERKVKESGLPRSREKIEERTAEVLREGLNNFCKDHSIRYMLD